MNSPKNFGALKYWIRTNTGINYCGRLRNGILIYLRISMSLRKIILSKILNGFGASLRPIGNVLRIARKKCYCLSMGMRLSARATNFLCRKEAWFWKISVAKRSTSWPIISWCLTALIRALIGWKPKIFRRGTSTMTITGRSAIFLKRRKLSTGKRSARTLQVFFYLPKKSR